MRYTRVFTAAGVCAPSRNAIITGRMQTSNGAHNMRTLMNTYPAQTGLPQSYSAVMPIGVRHLGEYLRAEGYYCTNNDKTDYQFEEQLTFWDATGSKAHFRNLQERMIEQIVYSFIGTAGSIFAAESGA
jgi:arylsulfatase A-like enzyme